MMTSAMAAVVVQSEKLVINDDRLVLFGMTLCYSESLRQWLVNGQTRSSEELTKLVRRVDWWWQIYRREGYLLLNLEAGLWWLAAQMQNQHDLTTTFSGIDAWRDLGILKISAHCNPFPAIHLTKQWSMMVIGDFQRGQFCVEHLDSHYRQDPCSPLSVK